MTLQELHKSCHKLFQAGMFEKYLDEESGDETYMGFSKACNVHDKLIEDSVGKRDCIGENFNQLIQRIDEEWFTNYTPGDNLDYYFFNYFLLLYLIVERVDLIFQVINQDGKSKLFNDFQFHNFKTLRKINKWANFIKHPKEFMFTHWPTYYIKDVHQLELSGGYVLIDTDFIFDHYFSEKKPRPIVLENHENVYVEVPNLEEVTREFCKEMNIFFDFICCNQVVADCLKKKSTLESFLSLDDIDLDNGLSDTPNE